MLQDLKRLKLDTQRRSSLSCRMKYPPKLHYCLAVLRQDAHRSLYRAKHTYIHLNAELAVPSLSVSERSPLLSLPNLIAYYLHTSPVQPHEDPSKSPSQTPLLCYMLYHSEEPQAPSIQQHNPGVSIKAAGAIIASPSLPQPKHRPI